MFDDLDGEIKKVYGDKSSLDLGAENKKFILHNHPNNEFFSNQDLAYFTTHKVEYMSIVKHNGDVSIIQKTNYFDYKKTAIFYNRLIKKYKNLIVGNETIGYNKVIQKLIEKYEGIKLY